VVVAASGWRARGYLVKPDAADDLLTAVEAILLGKRYVSKQLVDVEDPQPSLA